MAEPDPSGLRSRTRGVRDPALRGLAPAVAICDTPNDDAGA